MAEIIHINVEDLSADLIEEIKEKYRGAKLQIKVSPQPFSSEEEDWFWQVIAKLDWKKTNINEAIIKPVINYLSTESNERIFLFQDILSQKLHALDGQKFAENIGENAYGKGKYFSGDEFLYIRCAVIANGKKTYEEILKTPAKILKNKSFTPLLYLAERAYLQKNKVELNRLPAYVYETFFNEDGWGDKAIKL
ncbi:MAG: DUF4240 domain-containing protein [Saprospiraceae bacterium]